MHGEHPRARELPRGWSANWKHGWYSATAVEERRDVRKMSSAPNHSCVCVLQRFAILTISDRDSSRELRREPPPGETATPSGQTWELTWLREFVAVASCQRPENSIAIGLQSAALKGQDAFND